MTLVVEQLAANHERGFQKYLQSHNNFQEWLEVREEDFHLGSETPLEVFFRDRGFNVKEKLWKIEWENKSWDKPPWMQWFWEGIRYSETISPQRVRRKLDIALNILKFIQALDFSNFERWLEQQSPLADRQVLPLGGFLLFLLDRYLKERGIQSKASPNYDFAAFCIEIEGKTQQIRVPNPRWIRRIQRFPGWGKIGKYDIADAIASLKAVKKCALYEALGTAEDSVLSQVEEM